MLQVWAYWKGNELAKALQTQITGGVLTNSSLRFSGYITLHRFLEAFSYDVRSLYLQRHRDQKQRTPGCKKPKTILVFVRSWNKGIEGQALTPALELCCF